MITRLVAAFGLVAALLTSPLAVQAAPVNSGHVEVELVAQETSATPGGTVFVALRQTILKGWHTYWRNPGDSGEATQIVWTLPAGWKAGDIQWPAPQRLPVGPLMNFGYEGQVLLPVALQVPADAKPGRVTLKAEITYLVCADICIPEDATLTLDLPVAASGAGPDPKWGAAIGKTLAALPKAGDLTAVFAAPAAAPAADSRVKLALTGPAAAGTGVSDAFFYPFDGAVIDHAARQVVERGPEGLTLSIAPGFSFRQGPPPTALAGVVVIDGAAHEISAAAGPLPAGDAGLGPPPAKAAAAPTPDIGVGLALGLAFLGGLILNLMPCVFPVLSLKAAALARHAHEAPGSVRAQGLVFGLGVIVTFVGLAAALLAARAAGQAVGWGFQLQSPQVVAVLALIMLLVALNLSGVFEIGTSVQNAGSGLAAKGGLAGAFFTGVLAVVVAAPCTAPFMAGAIGFALVQPPVVALSVFLALALGLAAPFVALSFAPALLRKLPKPGAWMDTLKHVLAFPMYAAAAWLLWVLDQQTDAAGLARLLAAAVLAGLAAWLFGLMQTRRIEGRPALIPGLLAAAVLILAVAGVTAFGYAPPVVAGTATVATETGAELPSEPWSAERVAALQAEGRPVFVNFTAAWCVTCQVNDKVALSTKRAAAAFKAANAVYLVGDWTNRNGEIAAALAAQGRAGVPLYLVYPKGGGAPKVLPQLLTSGAVEKALKEAS
jgi:thiol:disulfide interchange protein